MSVSSVSRDSCDELELAAAAAADACSWFFSPGSPLVKKEEESPEPGVRDTLGPLPSEPAVGEETTAVAMVVFVSSDHGSNERLKDLLTTTWLSSFSSSSLSLLLGIPVTGSSVTMDSDEAGKDLNEENKSLASVTLNPEEEGN